MSARRRRKRGDGAGRRRAVIGSRGARIGRHLLASLGGEFGHIEFDVTESTREIDLQWMRGCGDLRLGSAQIQQHRRHLRGAVGGHTGFLDGVDDGVVMPHESGALSPADQGVGEGDPGSP